MVANGREGGERLRSAEGVGPHELPEPGRENVVGHEPDHRDGEETVDADPLHRPQEHLPAECRQPEPDEDRGEDRQQPDRTHLAEFVEDLIQADPPDGHPEKHRAHGHAEPDLAPHRSARWTRASGRPGTPPRGRRLELPVWGASGRVISRGSIPPASAPGQPTVPARPGLGPLRPGGRPRRGRARRAGEALPRREAGEPRRSGAAAGGRGPVSAAGSRCSDTSRGRQAG